MKHFQGSVAHADGQRYCARHWKVVKGVKRDLPPSLLKAGQTCCGKQRAQRRQRGSTWPPGPSSRRLAAARLQLSRGIGSLEQLTGFWVNCPPWPPLLPTPPQPGVEESSESAGWPAGDCAPGVGVAPTRGAVGGGGGGTAGRASRGSTSHWEGDPWAAGSRQQRVWASWGALPRDVAPHPVSKSCALCVSLNKTNPFGGVTSSRNAAVFQTTRANMVFRFGFYGRIKVYFP